MMKIRRIMKDIDTRHSFDRFIDWIDDINESVKNGIDPYTVFHIVGIMLIALPVLGIFSIVLGYAMADFMKVATGIVLLLVGTIGATLGGFVIYNEVRDAEQSSKRNHPAYPHRRSSSKSED
jgi:hypothetical protein